MFFMIEFIKGSKEFLALDDLSFNLEPGSLTGFLGANGAGKTTSLKILFKFIPPTNGQLNFSSELGKDWGEIRSNIGYVPERPYFYPHLNGHEFLNFTASLNDIKASQVKNKIEQWAERLGIAHALGRQLKGYSKGMLQRVGVLSCLIHDPKVIILDEPLSGLDPLGRMELKRAFKSLQDEGKTVFFSSHIVSDVEEVCDRVVVIDKGKLVYQGDVTKVLDEHSKDEYMVISTSKESYDLKEQVVEGDNLHGTLEELLKNNCRIEKVQKMRISLEEFVYSTRSNGGNG
jgi:ABC-2 type transport system ATP-binding protein